MSDPFEGKWVLVSQTPDKRTYELDMGDGQVIVRTETLVSQALMDENARIRADNIGKKWGEGQIIGRIPTPLYYSSGLAEASRQRDHKFIKKFWEDSDHRNLRTFEGKI